MSDDEPRGRLTGANMKVVADTGFLGTDHELLQVPIKAPVTEEDRNYNVGT
jgi:hypothetical protein